MLSDMFRAELTILALEKEGKRSQDTEEKNKEGKAMRAMQANHVQEVREQRERTLRKAKSVSNELTLQKHISQADMEKLVVI